MVHGKEADVEHLLAAREEIEAMVFDTTKINNSSSALIRYRSPCVLHIPDSLD